ncbi:VOC family protein [Streptomyces sp. NPDC051320]|uniref:VOC family protein n=1 Tax=Streptomyces sp. NPDC051320 TaxID=3154644 RepID=UPI003420070A
MPVRTTYDAGAACWIDRISAEPAGAEAFYAALLGWEYAEEGGYRTARSAGELVAGFGTAPGRLELWVVYLAAKDLDATAARVVELGGTVVLAPLDAGENGRLLLAADPAGTLVGFWQGRRADGVVLADETGAACRYELHVPETAAVAGFYAGLGADPAIRLVADPSGPAHWLVHFGVDSLTGAVRTALAAGARVTGYDDGSVRLLDARGARFGLVATDVPASAA